MKVCKIILIALISCVVFSQSIIAQCVTVKTIQNATCGNCNGQIDLNSTSCINPQYQWTGPNGFTATTPSIFSLCPGTYNLTFTHSLGTEFYSWTITEDIFQSHQWAVHPLANEGTETIIDMAVDPNGDVYAIGWYTYQINFGSPVGGGSPIVLSNTLQDTRAVFVAKWDYCGYIEAARTIAWSNMASDSINLHLELLNGTGPVVVAGEFDKHMNITGTQINSSGGFDIFLGILANANLAGLQQGRIGSTGGAFLDDRFKGMSAEGGTFAFCGSFKGNSVTIPGFPNPITINKHNPNTTYSDYFHCLYNWNGFLLTLQWATNNNLPSFQYNEHGMTMQYINPYIYYAYKAQVGTPPNLSSRGYLAQVNASNGALINTAVIDPTGQGYYFEIQDMTRFNGHLYLCGYRNWPSVFLGNEPVVLRYTTTINNPANIIIGTGGQHSYNSANKIYVDATGVYVTGSYQQSGFSFGGSISLILYGNVNHFVLKANTTTLVPVYLECMASTPSGQASSLGNAISYDANRNVFYLAGTFTGAINFHDFNQGQQISATNSQDAFIARFSDFGTTMQFRNMDANNGFVSSVPNISLFPNPSSGVVQINSTEPITDIVITDISGRNIIPVISGTENETVLVNMEHLQEGTYIIKVSTSGNVKLEKVILTK